MLAPTGVVLAIVPAIPPDLADRGTLFLDFTSPHTPSKPALATLLTGRDVFAHGVLDDDSPPPDPIAPQLPDLVAARGVEVAGPSAGALRLLPNHLAQDRPFLLIAVGAPPDLELPPHVLLFAVAETACLLVWPRRVPVGQRVRAQVRSLDVAPTVLDALGLADVAVEHWLPGASLLPLAESADPRTTYRELYLTDGRHRRGWRTPEWVLWESPEGTTLARPRNQLEDLAEAHPDVVAELRRRMLGHARRRAAETGRGFPDS